MFKAIIVLSIFIMTTVAYAAPTERQGVGALLTRDVPVQGFSPNGLYSNATATNADFHNLTNFLAASFYCASGCKLRLTPTAAKGAYPQVTVPSDSWFTIVKNTATPFVNISSASGATHEIMKH